MKWIMGSAAVIGTVAFVTSLVFFISVPLPTEVSDSATKSDGLSEGIQVHGDWVIEVHDPDGTLVEKREFENALQPSTGITGLLTGENKVDGWIIKLLITGPYTTNNFACKEAIGSGAGLSILEATVTVTNKPYLPFSLNTACTVTETGDDQMGQIASVQTNFYDYDGCTQRYDSDQPESGPVECVTIGEFAKNPSYAGDVDLAMGVTGRSEFTSHSLNPNIQVSEGQVVGVKVVISFD
jgi:hypothetical protein